MRKRVYVFSVCALAAFFFVSVPAALAGDDMCDLARVVLGKAAQSFARDRTRGLKLFIKAQQLCPDDPLFAYNLGVAYFQYGRMTEAAEFLGKAVAARGSNAVWRNNYALALLEKGDASAALTQAVNKGVKSAVDLCCSFSNLVWVL